MGKGRRRYERLRRESSEVDEEQNHIKNSAITLGGEKGRRRSNQGVELWKKMEGSSPKLGHPFKTFIATYEAIMLYFAHKLVMPQQW